MLYTPNKQIRINALQNKISKLKSDLTKYNNNLRKMWAAIDTLVRKRKEYEGRARARYSCPNRILNMDSLRLKGVENIQAAVNNIYNGRKEKNFMDFVGNSINAIKRKIDQEESRIKKCQADIRAAENELASLRSAY